MRLHESLPVLLIAIALAGCGGDESGSPVSSSSGADPAQAIPADAPVYVEAVVRPEGEQAENVAALLDRFLGGKTLADLIDAELAEDGQTYAEDIEPWLGGRVGIGVTDLAADSPGFVGAIAVTDAEAAEAALASAKNVEKAATIGDVQLYLDTSDDTLAGVTEEFIVFGEGEDTVRRGLETVDGEGIGDAERFQTAYEDVPAERLGSVYVDTTGLAEAAKQDPTLDPAGRAVIDQIFKDGDPITGALVAEPDSARVELRISTAGFGPFGAFVSGEAPALVAEAPAGSWLALGYTDVGETLSGAIDTFAGALGGAAITGQLEAQTGLDLERDLFSWMGDLAFFVRGETQESLDGALVMEVTDSGAAEAAIPKIIAAAKRSGAPVQEVPLDGAEEAYGLPVPDLQGGLIMAYGNERVVFAAGEPAAEAALSPGETIEDSGLYDRAGDSLDGLDPAFVLDMTTVLAFAEATGDTDADYEEAKPYLEKIDLVASGAEKDGDVYRSVVAVKAK